MSTRTTTLTALADALHYKLGIDPDAAETILTTYITQIEKTDARTINPDEINDEDADFLIGAITAAQKVGDLGHRELEALSEHMASTGGTMEERDQHILAALGAGARVMDIMEASGLSRPRIYQIKDRT